MNNYPDTVLVDTVPCHYIIYGKEIAPTTGTPHLQGHIVFKDAKTESSVKKLLPGCHVQVSVAPNKSVEYCKKDGDYTERGTPPVSKAAQGQLEKDRWANILEKARSGEHHLLDAKTQFVHGKLLDWHHTKALHSRSLPDTTAQHLWYYGESGSGKSRKARTDHPEAFLKMCNKWWDGYKDQDVVLIEDFDKVHQPLAHHMKIWADRYPFPAEMKGAGAVIRPKLIIVTANYHPSEIWSDDASLQPILRRFKCVHFKGPIADKKRKREEEEIEFIQ